MAAWRDTASDQVQADLDALLNAVLPFAEQTALAGRVGLIRGGRSVHPPYRRGVSLPESDTAAGPRPSVCRADSSGRPGRLNPWGQICPAHLPEWSLRSGTVNAAGNASPRTREGTADDHCAGAQPLSGHICRAGRRGGRLCAAAVAGDTGAADDPGGTAHVTELRDVGPHGVPAVSVDLYPDHGPPG